MFDLRQSINFHHCSEFCLICRQFCGTLLQLLDENWLGKYFNPHFSNFRCLSMEYEPLICKKYQIFKRRAAAQAVVYSSSRHYSNCFYMAADRNTNQANICDSQSHRSLCFCVYGPPQKIKYLKCTFQ